MLQWKTGNAWQSPACSPPGANAPAELREYWTKVHQIFIRRRRVGSSAVLRRAVMSCPLWNASAQNKGGVFVIFRWLATEIGYHSNVPWGIVQKGGIEGRIDQAHPHVYLSWKYGEDRSRTFWDNWSPRGPLKKESNIGNLYSPAGQAGRAKQFSYWELWPLLTTDRKLQLIWMALIRLSRLVHLHWPLMTQNSLYSLVDFLIPTWATPA